MNTTNNEPIYELICVGFGPAAIAVATAIEDEVRAGKLNEKIRSNVLFLEQSASTAWQGGLLLPGTNINHNYYRDLATPRNPKSEFTFANYLYEHNRLFEHGEWNRAVGRIEWSHYVGWVANKLSQYVKYNEAVTAIRPGVDHHTVEAGDNIYLAKQVLIAGGMEPYVPEVLEPVVEAIYHADGYLYYRSELESIIRSSSTDTNICIVGGGLSAGEIAIDLMSRNDGQQFEITSLQRGLPFRNYNMSSFTSQIYMPGETVRFSQADESQRRLAFDQTFSTNFSGVDVEFSNMFWNFLYERSLMGINNYKLLDRYDIKDARFEGERIHIEVDDNLSNETQADAYDIVICATGYFDSLPERLFANCSSGIKRESDGKMCITTDYRLAMTDDALKPIWLNGHCEHTHGISDTQSFSMVAHKADRLLPSVMSHFSETMLA